MARTFAVEEMIDRPAAEVWEALTDWSNAHRWMPGVDRMEAQGETAEGTEIRFQARNAERASVIARCETGRSIVLRSVQGGVTADYTYELHPAGDGATRVTLVAECRFRGLLLLLMSPLIRHAIRRADSIQLERLKEVVEAG
jgi:carbon monoxide dehydrogenase subunit G